MKIGAQIYFYAVSLEAAKMIRVLIIDADLDNCKRIKYALQEQDDEMDVYYTLSVLEAIDRLVKESYQLVMCWRTMWSFTTAKPSAFRRTTSTPSLAARVSPCLE